MITPCYRYRALLDRVIDGDTYVLFIDHGFRCWSKQPIRLRNYSAPELNEPGGLEAKERAAGIFAMTTEIVIESYKDQMSFARWVADIYVDGLSLAEKLSTPAPQPVMP